MRPVGILGGMGPQASIEAYARIIRQSIRLGAEKNEEFPHLLISNLPVPSLVASRARESESVLMVEKEARRLINADCEAVVLACNTMHLFEPSIQRGARGKFYSLPKYVAETAKARGGQAVGILGTPSTLTSGLYAAPLRSSGLRAIQPSGEDITEMGRVIEQIIAGREPSSFTDFLQTQICSLAESGADTVVLGCTELPLVPLGPDSAATPKTTAPTLIIDSMEMLAEMTCFLYYRQEQARLALPEGLRVDIINTLRSARACGV